MSDENKTPASNNRNAQSTGKWIVIGIAVGVAIGAAQR